MCFFRTYGTNIGDFLNLSNINELIDDDLIVISAVKD